MHRLALNTALLALLLPVAAVAQTAAPDATTRQLAAALVDLTNPPAAGTAQIEQQLKAMRDGQAVRGVLSQNPQLRMELAKNTPAANAGIARVGAAQADAMGPILREMQTAGRQASIDAYARNFTAAELQAILAFNRSPVGAKLMRMQPQMARAVNSDLQAKFGPRVQAVEKSLATRLQSEMPKMFPQLVPGAK